jgi:hypothetical protein
MTDNYRLLNTFYFSMTTLAKIGYGDRYPVSSAEKLLMVFIMFSGMVFFSYVLEQFIYIIQTDPGPAEVLRTVDKQGETIRLQHWLIQLQRYRENKPLPPSFQKATMSHFKNYWDENRMQCVLDEHDYLGMLPKSLQKAIVVGYLFDDIFSDFRQFFRPDLYY